MGEMIASEEAAIQRVADVFSENRMSGNSVAHGVDMADLEIVLDAALRALSTKESGR